MDINPGTCPWLAKSPHLPDPTPQMEPFLFTTLTSGGCGVLRSEWSPGSGVVVLLVAGVVKVDASHYRVSGGQVTYRALGLGHGRVGRDVRYRCGDTVLPSWGGVRRSRTLLSMGVATQGGGKSIHGG